MNGFRFVRPAARSRVAGGTLTGLVLALVIVTGVGLWRASANRVAPAPDFTLVDQDGASFTLSRQLGHPIVLFFGYTHCPDECPTTLAHLAKALAAKDVPRDASVAFITVDPARDSPAVLKRYVALFSPHFFGLTGTLATLTPVYAAYHTPREAEHGAGERGDDAFAHGTTIYYIGRDGSVAGLGQWDDSPDLIARDLRRLR